MTRREKTAPGLQFRLFTLMAFTVIAAVVAAVYARVASLMLRTENPWFLVSLPVLNLVLLIAGTALSSCKSSDLRALGLGCWLLLVLLMGLSIGLCLPESRAKRGAITNSLRIVELAQFRYNSAVWPQGGTMRVGIGHDTHRLGQGGPLRLGGVEIPHDRHLLGHSDADVLLHAITDALLGAAALGDIGELFPDTAESNRGRDSAEMLRIAHDRVKAAGFQVVNLDCIVFAQRPKLSPFKEPIRRRIAEILALSPEQVGVKAKTGEGVDAVGREEAIMAQCVALLE